MGRKEKSLNANIASSAPTSIISKRTYTRQIPCNTTETSFNVTNQLENVKMDILNKTESKQTDYSSSNDTDGNSQLEVSNGLVSKCTRRSTLKKPTANTVEIQPTNNAVSMISQRPRRQIKHKFIKSANANVTVKSAKSVTSSDVSNESTSLLSSLSPNSKMRLVPMVYRLPLNASKLNWQDVIGNSSTETIEMESSATTIEENEPGTSVTKGTKMERNKKVQNCKKAARRIRQSRRAVSPVEPVEYNDTSENNDEVIIENKIVAQNIITDNHPISEYYDDEDDIMIVEEKDALDVPDQIEFVAEEVIIEETVGDDDYAEIVCVSPKYLSEITNLNDESSYKEIYDDDITSGFENEPLDYNEGKLPQTEPMNTEQEDTQTEPIYLSDSLSCFDSDSDTQHSEIPALPEKHDETEGIASVLEQQADECDETEPLNESADDVIIVQECTDTIEIDRSDTEDERFANIVSFEPCVESDSQPSIDCTKQEDNDNIFKSAFNNLQIYETTTDADDDSSEVEKRNVRSRRDNISRKNYSCRRNYARRKAKNDLNAPYTDEMNSSKNEDHLSNESQQIITIEYSNPEECLSDQTFENNKTIAMVQESNTTDATDEENHFNFTRTKTVRTYIRKRASTSNSTSDENHLNASEITPSNNENQASDFQAENMNTSGYTVQVSDDSKSVSNSIPKKRGRPRKKALLALNLKSKLKSAVIDEKGSNSSSGNQSPPDVPEYISEKNEQDCTSTQYDIAPELQQSIEIHTEVKEATSPTQITENSIVNEMPENSSDMRKDEMEVEMADSTIVSESNEVSEHLSNVDNISSIKDDCHETAPNETTETVDAGYIEMDTVTKIIDVECTDKDTATETIEMECIEENTATETIDAECTDKYTATETIDVERTDKDTTTETIEMECIEENTATEAIDAECTEKDTATETIEIACIEKDTATETIDVECEIECTVKDTATETIEIACIEKDTTTEIIDVECTKKDISMKINSARYDGQTIEKSTDISCATGDPTNDRVMLSKEQHTAMNVFILGSSAMETINETTIIPQPKQIELDEPVIESISVKIEKIAIDAEPKEIIQSESKENFKKMQSVDIEPYVNKLEIKAEESNIQIKSDEVKSQKEVTSALVDLSNELIVEIEDTSIRRSGRIRTINKTKQRSQGLGLVKDKKRTPVIIDEDSSNTSFDVATDNTVDTVSQSGGELKVRIKSEEELEREKINRENGMKLFIAISDNEYRSERTISKEAKKMTCDCFLTQSEIERGEMGCGDDCLNRMLLIECGPKCVVGDRCTNRRFQKHQNSACNIFKTEKKGYGLIATSYIPAGVFIMEYVGEVLNSKQFEKRASDYSKQMNAHYYFMALSSDCVIDATKKGNISRFINHSCDPNAETQKWTVNGELRIGFFSKKAIMPDEEITFDYQFQRYGKEAQKCYCESINCRGWIGGEPDSEEEIESDDEEESEDDVAAGLRDENELSESKISVTPDETTKKKTKTPKPKKPKDATKKPVKRELNKSNRKISNDFKKHMNRAEIMEDPDLDKEIDVLAKTGLKNQAQTLQFSRLMVRAKLQKAKLRLLQLLGEGELPCRRLFLDYHGLKLMHSWMSDINSSDRLVSLTFRLEVLKTLENLPITNKTMLQDSKVLSTVQRWSVISEYSFPSDEVHTSSHNQKPANATNDESSPSDSGSGTPVLNDETSSPKVYETPACASLNLTANADSFTVDQKPLEIPIGNKNSKNVKPSDMLNAIPQILEQNSTIKGMGVDLLKSIISTTEKNTKIIEDSEKLPDGEIGKLVRDICLLASKLVSSWKQLPESFKIPKKLRIEQMKEHEREADESYKENVEEKTAQKTHSTFSSTGRFSERVGKTIDTTDTREKDPREKDPRFRRSFNSSTLSKHQRRQMFEAKVAQEDAERKKTMEHIIHEARCAFFQLDPRITRDFMVPVCVNPTTGQWYGDKMVKIPTPPSHSHIKPPPVPLPTEINEYIIPPIDLPDLWKFAINERGQIYYYHTKILLPQWEPPIKLLPLMEEHRINDIDIKVENIDTPQHTVAEDDHEMEHDCDDEDEDVVSLLSNSTMNANCLLELKSDPILEKYNDDDSSSTDSDDSLVNELAELEAKYSYIKKKTEAYWINMKRPPNLNEEIAAMAKSDPACISTQSIESVRARDDEKQHSFVAKINIGEELRRKKKCRKQLVQEIRISPLSEEMKRELRRDSRRYKENKAKLRRQKEMLLKRKNDVKISHADVPVRKLKKITEGLPQVSKHIVDSDSHGSIDNNLFSIASFSSSRYNNDSFEVKRTKSSAFAPLPAGGISVSPSSSLNTSLSTMDTSSRTLQASRNSLLSTSLTQSIVNKLPSIGHKFVGDTEELIMKNTIKPIKPVESVSALVTAPVVSTIRNTPIQQQQQLVKKPSHSIVSTSKSSPKPLIKKKKTSDPNEGIDVNSPAAKKIKEKFKSDISGHIVYYLKPYFSKTCTVGQIQSSDDFRHLARKLTFFVMLKELKYCNNVSLLEVTDSVKNKAREYIKKYMSKFGKTYIRDENEKDYHFEDL